MQLIQKIIDKAISVMCCKKINLSIEKLCRQSVNFFAERMGVNPAAERAIVELSSESSTISDDEIGFFQVQMQPAENENQDGAENHREDNIVTLAEKVGRQITS